jgi:hypothetical protein
MQVLIDATRLSTPLMWLPRLSAPVAAVIVSGGFFGVAFFPQCRWLLYFGGVSLCVAVLRTGVGLVSNLPSTATNPSPRLHR